jgi:hypothetical protein
MLRRGENADAVITKIRIYKMPPLSFLDIRICIIWLLSASALLLRLLNTIHIRGNDRFEFLSKFRGLICRGHSTVPLQAIYIKKLNIKSKSCLWSHQRQFFDLKIIFFNIKGSWGTVKRPPGIITPKFICKIK